MSEEAPEGEPFLSFVIEAKYTPTLKKKFVSGYLEVFEKGIRFFMDPEKHKCRRQLIFENNKITQSNLQIEISTPDGIGKVYLKFEQKSDSTKVFSILKGLIESKKGYTMENFTIISVIGRGTFGKVMLVKHKTTGQFYAIKSVRKKELRLSGQPQWIVAERNILMFIQNPFIVHLHFAFQTSSKFYLGLEYVPGGDLFTLLQKNGVVKPYNARIYISELCLAIDYLHRCDVVYRDLKPENILFDTNGHIKLTDFGLAKDLYESGTTTTFCGTYFYVSPEIILHKPYNYAVDWWALGVIICEMLSGEQPFHGDTRQDIFESIVNAEPDIPECIEPTTRDFIRLLLNKDPTKRPTFDEFAHHPYFAGIEWDDIYHKRVLPSYVPPSKDLGTANFDNAFTDEAPIDSPGNSDRLYIDGFSFCSDGEEDADIEPDEPICGSALVDSME